MIAQVLVRRSKSKDTKLLPCLSGRSSGCKGIIKTTIERRICDDCSRNIDRESQVTTQQEKEDDLCLFWSRLK